MSSPDKDPLGKEDTPSEYSESHSDSEVDKAEETLDHLKLQERLSKDSSVESKSSDSSYQERRTVSEEGPKTVPIARSKALKESHLPFSDVQSDPGPQTSRSFGLQKEKDAEAKGVEGTVSEVDESTLSYVSPPPSESSLSTPPLPPREDELFRKNPPLPPKTSGYVRGFFHQSSSKSDDACTSSDASSINTEEASYSGKEGQHDDQPPNYAPDLERQSSGASDSNISDFLDDKTPLPTSSLSTTSTPSSTFSLEKHEPYTIPMRKKDMDDFLAGTSLGVAMSKQTELDNLKKLGLVGDTGFYRRSNMDVSDLSIGGSEEHVPREALRPESEPLEALLFRREQDLKESSQRDDLTKGSEQGDCKLEGTENATIGLQKDEERTEFSDSGAGSSSGRRETSEIKDSKVSPKTQTGRKPWQKPGNLRSMQLPTLTSKDSISSRGSDPTSPSGAQSLELMETEDKDESLEKMETTADESVASETGLPESRPTMKASNQTNILGAKRPSNEEEPMSDAEMSERKARKYKRPDKNLTNSPPSDEIMGSTLKPETHRPSKKARSGTVSRKMRRTRSDSKGIPKGVDPDYRHKSESSTSDGSGDDAAM